MINHDGRKGMFQQAHDADAMQGRIGAYGNVFCENPGEIVIGTW